MAGFMAGLVFSAVILGFVYVRRCTFGALLLGGFVLLFLAALSASWIAATVSVSLFLSAISLPLLTVDPKRRTKLLGLIVSGALILASIPIGQRAWKRIQLRDQYPFVSLRQRTQAVNPTHYFVDQERLNERIRETQAIQPSYYPSQESGGRSRSIRALHRSAVYHFLETPEFGVIRMAYPSLRVLEESDGTPILLPEDSDLVARTIDEASAGQIIVNTVALERSLEKEHNDFRFWFLEQERFGEVKDVDQVAGFLPHAFTNKVSKRAESVFEPAAHGKLKLQRLQLVGLLYHAEPVVYVLDTLPEMLSAATAPTRALDEFEKRGLEQLVSGEAIYTERIGNKVHMLGSLLNSDSCTTCHPGPPNQLLGAFSYELEHVFEPTDSDTRLTRR